MEHEEAVEEKERFEYERCMACEESRLVDASTF